MSSSGPTKPIPEGAWSLTEFLQDRFDDQLRSVIWYDRADFEVLYGREDVLAAYSADEIADVVEELSMDALTKPMKEEVYRHGDLRCIVECYEHGIEMHVVLSDGEGIAVGLEPAALVSQNTFVGRCLEKVELVD